MIRSIKRFVKNTYIFQQFAQLVVVVSKIKECKINPLKPLIIFDVGANDGSSFLDIALLFSSSNKFSRINNFYSKIPSFKIIMIK